MVLPAGANATYDSFLPTYDEMFFQYDGDYSFEGYPGGDAPRAAQSLTSGPLKSSTIQEASYSNGRLTVVFRSGPIWAYPASEQVFNGLINAESAGRYFAAKVQPLGGRRVL